MEIDADWIQIFCSEVAVQYPDGDEELQDLEV
jgi:hypothetical protein